MTDWVNTDYNMTYKDLGLNKFLMGSNSPINLDEEFNSAIKFDGDNERGAVTNSFIRNLKADKIAAGTIASNVIYAGTLNGGQINGGTLTLGGTTNGNGVMEIKNATGTTVIRGDNLGHTYYTDTGTAQIRVDEDGLTAFKADGSTGQFAITRNGFYTYGTTDDLLNFRETPSSTVSYGQMGYGSGGMWISSNASKNIFIMANSEAHLIGSDGVTIFSADSSGTAEILSAGAVDIGAVGDGKDLSLTSLDDVVISAADEVRINCSGDFKLNGSTKTAVVPTSVGYKALYCIESPEVWFMDFCTDKNKLDPLFMEVTVPPYKFIKCDDGDYQVWGKRKGFDSVRFESKTSEDFTYNNKIYSAPDRADLDTKLQSLKNRVDDMSSMKTQQLADLNTKLDNTKEVIK